MHGRAEAEAPAAPAEAPQSERAGWFALAILTLLYVMSMLDRNILTLVGSSVQKDLGIGDIELGLLYGPAFGFFYAVGAIPLGWAIDRFSRRKVIFWCVTSWSLATAACGLASGFRTLFVARAAVGAGESGLLPGAQSILSDLFARTRLALPLSIFVAGAKTGQAFSLLLGGLLTMAIVPAGIYTIPGIGYSLEGWRLIFVIIGLPGLLLAFLIFTIPEPPRGGAPSGGVSRGYREYIAFALRHLRILVPHHMAMLLSVAIAAMVIAWSPMFLERAHGMSPAAAGTQLGASILAGSIIGNPIHGLAIDRWFARGRLDAHFRYLAILAFVALPFGLAAFLGSNATISIVLIGLFIGLVAAHSAIPPVALQLLVAGDLRGKAASSLTLIAGLPGIALGPMAVAFVTEKVLQDPGKVGTSIAICLTVMLPACGMLHALAMRPMRTTLAAG